MSTQVRPVDALCEMLDEIRATRPFIHCGDEWSAWKQAIGQTLLAFPNVTQRWAAAVLVADDLCRSMPGLSLGDAYEYVKEMMQQVEEA